MAHLQRLEIAANDLIGPRMDGDRQPDAAAVEEARERVHPLGRQGEPALTVLAPGVVVVGPEGAPTIQSVLWSRRRVAFA